jgi:hypothetical protein
MFSILFLFGCIDIKYDAEQQFNEDGTSSLTVTEYMGPSKSLPSSLESLSSISDPGDPAYFALIVMMEYYSTPGYPSFLCDVIGDAVDGCVAKNDGSLKVQIDLQPGEFYSFEKQMDWVNLKERRIYTIEEVPSASYYAGMQDATYDDAMLEDMKDHFEKNSDRYLQTEAYCSGGYTLTCEVLAVSGDVATVRLSSALTPKQVVWAACSSRDSTSFLFMNESEAKSSVVEVVSLGTAISSDSPVTFNVKCPTSSKTLVIGYKSKSYTGGYSDTTVDAMDMMSKDEMKTKILEQFEESFDSASYSSFETPTADYDESVLSFKKGMALGHDFSELEEFSGTTATMLSMDISMDYSAKFPNKVLNATAGGEAIKVKGNEVKLSIDDLKSMDSGSLVVVTEKEISPLGIFTWVIPIIVIGLIVLVVLFKLLRG